jgi:hypothetical protein
MLLAGSLCFVGAGLATSSPHPGAEHQPSVFSEYTSIRLFGPEPNLLLSSHDPNLPSPRLWAETQERHDARLQPR